MVQLNFKKALSLFLAALMANPSGAWAGASAAVVGSINSYGAVTVGKSAAPASSTLFAGDTVNTLTGNAVVQYEQGARVMLAKSSTAVFSPRAVELKSGQLSFSTGSDMVINATSLRLEPMSPKTSADVIVNDGKASVTVREGSVRAVDPTGVSLAVIPAGEAKLFAMASASASPASAPAPASASAAAPPIGVLGAMWLVILGGAIGGTILGVTVAQNSDNDSEIEDRSASPIR